MGRKFILSDRSIMMHGILLDKGYSPELADFISVFLDTEASVIRMINYLQENTPENDELLKMTMDILGCQCV